MKIATKSALNFLIVPWIVSKNFVPHSAFRPKRCTDCNPKQNATNKDDTKVAILTSIDKENVKNLNENIPLKLNIAANICKSKCQKL